MIYRSNLTASDLAPYFKLLDPPRQIAGHDAPSDPDFQPDCTFWTHDEAAILFTIAQDVGRGTWADIGTRLGWTAAHVIAADHQVILVDPELRFSTFNGRMEKNLAHCWDGVSCVMAMPWHIARQRLSENHTNVFDGFVIDGCHDSPEPLNDAMGALAHAEPDCIIMFHDFMGAPVRDAVRWLMDQGWHCRVYWTPNGVACCWRGHEGWMPPMHVADPRINWPAHKKAMVDFKDYWSRCE